MITTSRQGLADWKRCVAGARLGLRLRPGCHGGVNQGFNPSASRYPALTRVLSNRAFRIIPSKAARTCVDGWARLFLLRKRIARQLLIGDELVPKGGFVEATHARPGFHPLVSPERPAHIVPLEREPETLHPIVQSLTGTRPGRSGRYSSRRSGGAAPRSPRPAAALGPVQMESIDELTAETCIIEYVEAQIRLHVGDEKQVVAVDLLDGRHDFLVGGVEDWLDGALPPAASARSKDRSRSCASVVSIIAGDATPDPQPCREASRILEEIGIAVIDIPRVLSREPRACRAGRISRPWRSNRPPCRGARSRARPMCLDNLPE